MTQNRSGRSLMGLAFALAITSLSLVSVSKSEAIPPPILCAWNQDAVYKYYEDGVQVGYKRVYGCNSQYAPSTWGYQTTSYTTTCYPCSLN